MAIVPNADSIHYTYVWNDSMGGFWLIRPDGANMHRVSSTYLDEPDWHPSSNWVAYEGSGGIWKVPTSGDSLDTSAAAQVHAGPGANPNWTPDGNRLFYTIGAGTDAGSYIIAGDGGQSAKFGGWGWSFPDWGAPGGPVLFLGDVSSRFGIATCDTTGQNAQVVAPAGTYPTWSPTGTMFAFIMRDNSSRQQLWIANSSGGSIRQLTTAGVAQSFSWSPDGSEIAFVDFRRSEHTLQNGTIWVVNVATGGKRQLTRN